MAKTVEYSREALRALQRIDRSTAARIVAKVDQLAREPASLANNVKALKGGATDDRGPLMRLRVGDWRIIYRDGTVLRIERIAPRASAYD